MSKNKLKMTIVGDSSVGKKSMAVKYTTGKDNFEYTPTVLDVHNHTIIVDGVHHDVEIWLTAGQEDYDRLRPLHYPGTDVVILCYAVTRRFSFENVQTKWIPEIRHYLKKTPIILVGLRKDQQESYDIKGSPCITTEEGQILKDQIMAEEFLECSMLDKESINQVFLTAVKVAISPKKKSKHGCRLM